MVNLKSRLKTPQHLWYKAGITHHCHTTMFQIVNECLDGLQDGGLQKQRFMQSCLGHFMEMQQDMSFSRQLVHMILLRQLHHDGPNDELRFMFGRHATRFSKVEFCLITGLRFGEVPNTNQMPRVENGIHDRILGAVYPLDSRSCLISLLLVRFNSNTML